MVVLNFQTRNTTLESIPAGEYNLFYSTARENIQGNLQSLQLAPYEVLILAS